MEPKLEDAIEYDALRVWLDFWEITGALTLDIVRRTPSGGDPEKMIPPEYVETVIPHVKAILIGGNPSYINDRSGELDIGALRLELIDAVHRSDILRVHGVDYEVEWVEEKDFGEFAIWTVQVRRMK